MVFSLPLDSGERLLGLIECVGTGGILFGCVFAIRTEHQTDAQILEIPLRPENSIFRGQFGHAALKVGNWPIHGISQTANIEEWSMPGFVLGSGTGISYYNRKMEFVRFERGEGIEANGLTLLEDSFYPYLALERRIQVLYKAHFPGVEKPLDETNPLQTQVEPSLGPEVDPIFDLDDVSDWLSEVTSRNFEKKVRDAIQKVVTAGADFLDIRDGAEALAAAELLCALNGNPSLGLGNHDEVQSIVAKKRKSCSELLRILPDAAKAVERVNQQPSELFELQADSNQATWTESIRSLMQRLKPISSGKVTVCWAENEDASTRTMK